mmetsp:Transcript_8662/g.23297  ORF Transcript_8662/g.23297 Transcript_8662/m.23297 type:complete len:292 (-) Transcript_8662:1176-2051(-)
MMDVRADADVPAFSFLPSPSAFFGSGTRLPAFAAALLFAACAFALASRCCSSISRRESTAPSFLSLLSSSFFGVSITAVTPLFSSTFAFVTPSPTRGETAEVGTDAVALGVVGVGVRDTTLRGDILAESLDMPLNRAEGDVARFAVDRFAPNRLDRAGLAAPTPAFAGCRGVAAAALPPFAGPATGGTLGGAREMFCINRDFTSIVFPFFLLFPSFFSSSSSLPSRLTSTSVSTSPAFARTSPPDSLRTTTGTAFSTSLSPLSRFSAVLLSLSTTLSTCLVSFSTSTLPLV